MNILERAKLALTSSGKLRTDDDGNQYLRVVVASGGTAFKSNERVIDTTEGINPDGKLTNYMKIDGDCGAVPYVARLDGNDKPTLYVNKISGCEYHEAIRRRAERMKETQVRTIGA